MSNIRDIVPQAAVSCDKKTVLIELICADEYAARVLFDDVVSRVTSGDGLKLRLRGRLEAESEASS
jgi:hypothetical protein